jgi:hypothetical protein
LYGLKGRFVVTRREYRPSSPRPKSAGSRARDLLNKTIGRKFGDDFAGGACQIWVKCTVVTLRCRPRLPLAGTARRGYGIAIICFSDGRCASSEIVKG